MAVGKGRQPRVLLIVNEASVPVGTFGPTLRDAGLELNPWHIFAEPRRSLSGYDAVVALGGTMHPDEDDAYAWLAPERALLRDAVRRGLPVIGVCLGAQLLSQALGGRVWRRPLARVGWAPPALTPSAAHDPLGNAWRRPDQVLFWHGVSFTLPPGAELLAGTAQSVEAFRAGGCAWGFQYHLEADLALATAWADGYPEHLAAAQVDRARVVSPGPLGDPSHGVLVADRFAALVRSDPEGAANPNRRYVRVMTEPVNTDPEKDPDAWTTGDEPMTGPQRSYLHTLAQEAGEEPPGDDITKAEASKRIDALQERTGRGA